LIADLDHPHYFETAQATALQSSGVRRDERIVALGDLMQQGQR
jgi:hypothetical protein